MLVLRQSRTLSAMFVVLLSTQLAHCGASPKGTTNTNDLLFAPGAAATKAYLEPRDLSDEFLFQVTTLSASNFYKDALSYSSAVTRVSLKVDPPSVLSPKLRIFKAGEVGALMSFDVAYNREGRIEVDFASAGPELSFSTARVAAPISIEGSDEFAWAANGRQTVTGVSQDAHTIIADIKHDVTSVKRGSSGQSELGRHGTIELRLYLHRANQVPALDGQRRTVGDGVEAKIGYFSSKFLETMQQYGDDLDEFEAVQRNTNIQRMPLPKASAETLTIYLKGFPEAYYEVAKSAVESWNIAFGRKVLTAKPAPTGVDHGDPRQHVIKWVDDLDETVPWAGVTKAIVDPSTGVVLNANILINGSFNVKVYRPIYNMSKILSSKDSSAAKSSPHVQLGDLPLTQNRGETPVVPFFTDPKAANFDEYMKSYYYGVIIHEMGHALGLRHNFAASTQLDPTNNLPTSVMDYAPRPVRGRASVPGAYDIAAIRWGYFGQTPPTRLAYCSDEHDSYNVYCNKGDLGDPFSYTVSALSEAVSVISRSAMVDKKSFDHVVEDLLANALKFKRLNADLPADRRDSVVADIDRVLNPAFRRVLTDFDI